MGDVLWDFCRPAYRKADNYAGYPQRPDREVLSTRLLNTKAQFWADNAVQHFQRPSAENT